MTALDDRFRSCIAIGQREHAKGDLRAALAAYRQGLDLIPDHPDAHGLYGSALLQCGDATSALVHLETAARARRNDPRVIGTLAQAYFSTARYAEACEAFRKASRLEPREGQFQLGIANSLAMQGKLGEAETLLRRLCARYPDNAAVWYNFGNVMRDLRQPDEAIRCFSKALEIEPGFLDARNNMGRALHAQHRFDEAEREYRACLELDPDHTPAQLNLASVLINAGAFQTAESVCRNMLTQTPEVTLAHTFLGTALGHQGKVRQALECHRVALTMAQDDPMLAQKYAVALAHGGELEAALAELTRALEMKPDSSALRLVRANTLLAWGRVTEGWADYAGRPAFVQLLQSLPVPPVRSLPDTLRGANLTLLSEQGLGDELFFLRFAAQLHDAGARITYRTSSSKLLSLLARVPALAEVVDHRQATMAEDAAMPIGDLPHALAQWRARSPSALPEISAHPSGASPFGAENDTVSFPPPLALTPLETAVDVVRERLAGIGKPPYIAVNWSGGTPPREQRTGNHWALFKTIPIEALAGALRDVSGTVVVIQRNPRAGEMQAFRAALRRDVHDFSAANDDLEAMLALLSLVDECIGVSNTNMHLRAGVGRSARVLVPRPEEWRWMAAGDASPWFPGFSIYRQTLDGDWGEALDALARDLSVWR